MYITWYLKSGLEILFFSSCIYFFSLWLKKDKRHNLLLHFYGYCSLFCVASLLNLATVVTFLLYAAPFTFLLFIIFHQELLQRNFVTLRHSSMSIQEDNADWIEQLIRASLHAINNKKQLMCVIEHHSDLKPFISTPIVLQSPLTQNLLTLVIDSSGFDHNKMVWCSSHARLVAINATWNITHDAAWQTQEVKELDAWLHDALLMTLKTDIIVFKANPSTRAFDIVVKGALHSTLPAHHALSLIKKQLLLSHKGDSHNDRIDQKRILEQQNH